MLQEMRRGTVCRINRVAGSVGGSYIESVESIQSEGGFGFYRVLIFERGDSQQTLYGVGTSRDWTGFKTSIVLVWSVLYLPYRIVRLAVNGKPGGL
jgi:hypothetical protein